MNKINTFGAIISNVSPVTAIKAALCALMVLVLSYVVLFQGGQEAKASRGARAAEGIHMTSRQAEDMSHTANAVSTLIEDAVVHPQASSPSSDVKPLGANTHEAVAPDTQYARRIETLVNSWKPSYAAARADIRRFEHRFATAEDRLIEYFKDQSELTQSVNDPRLRSELMRRDAEERDAYKRWTIEGSQLLDRALAMGRELDDMDVIIRKQQLTISMLSQYTRESSIPSSAESLYSSLSEFRLQSDKLARDLSTDVFN